MEEASIDAFSSDTAVAVTDVAAHGGTIASNKGAMGGEVVVLWPCVGAWAEVAAVAVEMSQPLALCLDRLIGNDARGDLDGSRRLEMSGIGKRLEANVPMLCSGYARPVVNQSVPPMAAVVVVRLAAAAAGLQDLHDLLSPWILHHAGHRELRHVHHGLRELRLYEKKNGRP